ncbi:MAG: ABC transporter permease [Chloroflexi bacterium]|nr:ABC transporter permease [Chloroflexota bacterium]
MINLFQAEWQKAVGNRWVTGFLVWIFPVGMLSFIVFSSIAMLLSSSFREGFAQGITSWTDSMVNVWAFVTNPFGRMFLIGFMAVTFAGEYQWQTWKNIVPRSGRASLILMKFVVVTLIFLLTFILVSIILGVGQGIQAQIADVPYGPAFSLDVGLDFYKIICCKWG